MKTQFYIQIRYPERIDINLLADMVLNKKCVNSLYISEYSWDALTQQCFFNNWIAYVLGKKCSKKMKSQFFVQLWYTGQK